MSDLNEMHVFDEDFLSSEEKAVLEPYVTSDDFDTIKESLLRGPFKEIRDFAKDINSLKSLVIVKRAYTLGPEYAKAITSELDEEEQTVALYGFEKELNIIEQIKGGEKLENLILLIDASKYKEFNLMDYFDPTGSYINYPKISKFLQNMEK